MRGMMSVAAMLAVGAAVPMPGYSGDPMPVRERTPKHPSHYPDPRAPSDRNPGAPAQAAAKRERRADRQRATWQGRRVDADAGSALWERPERLTVVG